MISSDEHNNVGVCQEPPIGTSFGIFRGLAIRNEAQPFLYYPLTSDLQAYTEPHYNDIVGSMMVTFLPDDTFESAVFCDGAERDVIKVQGVQQGFTSYNMWFKWSPTDTSPSALFSSNISVNGLAASLVIYLTQERDTSDGILQAAIERPDGTRVFEEIVPNARVVPGEWTMITLSQSNAGDAIFDVYIDSSYMGRISPDPTKFAVGFWDSNNLLINEIYLCWSGIQSGTLANYYTGSVVHLMVFDQRLDQKTISSIYNDYSIKQLDQTEQGSESNENDEENDNQGLSSGEIAGIVVGSAVVLTMLIASALFLHRQSGATSFKRYVNNTFDDGSDPNTGEASPNAQKATLKFPYPYPDDEIQYQVPSTPAARAPAQNKRTDTPSSTASSASSTSRSGEQEVELSHANETR